MKALIKTAKPLALFGLALLVVPNATLAQHYVQKNLVSDIAQPDNTDGSKVLTDPNLKNPWGLTRSSSSPWWVANNNSGTSTLYLISAGAASIVPINGNGVVDIPLPQGVQPPPPSAPTGVVFNGSADFVLPNGRAAAFIFVTEDGTISGWNGGQNAIRVVDNSDGGSPKGAVYKGATIGEVHGNRYLYVTNFRSGKVEVYNSSFGQVRFEEGVFEKEAFDDERIPEGYAPFNVQNIGGSLFVTYAKQDGPRHDPVGGDGFGFVDIYTPSGRLISRLEHGYWLNAPWGVVWTTRDFGEFSNSILVGNFRSGWIAAYNGFTGKFVGFVKNPDNSLVTIDGLWSLTFGNDGKAGPANTLFFTAGINGETDGLFGTITPADGLDGDEE